MRPTGPEDVVGQSERDLSSVLLPLNRSSVLLMQILSFESLEGTMIFCIGFGALELLLNGDTVVDG